MQNLWVLPTFYDSNTRRKYIFVFVDDAALSARQLPYLELKDIENFQELEVVIILEKRKFVPTISLENTQSPNKGVDLGWEWTAKNFSTPQVPEVVISAIEEDEISELKIVVNEQLCRQGWSPLQVFLELHAGHLITSFQSWAQVASFCGSIGELPTFCISIGEL